MKKSSPPFEIKGERVEYHWYEHPGIGKVEMKRKQVGSDDSQIAAEKCAVS